MERNVISLKGNNSNKCPSMIEFLWYTKEKQAPLPANHVFSKERMNLSNLGKEGHPRNICAKLFPNRPTVVFDIKVCDITCSAKNNLRYPCLVCKTSPFRKTTPTLTLCLLVLSAHSLCKQFWPRSGPTKCPAWSGSKLFDSLMVFLKEFFVQKGWFWEI